MTVASLWKALDRAGCGKCVGTKELQEHHLFHPTATHKTIHPWNYNEMKRSSENQIRPSLAVDLSIWICEALTSVAMAENHANPALQLVYCRTVKLLSMGIKLVVVIEGKRRLRRTEGNDEDYKFKKRRSGTAFWNACKVCQEMLRLLGVPVVQAKAEGEALCALLNQRGIVDGVISNDGDCLLFGAKVLYTNFSIENLDQSKVKRYDSNHLKALLDDDDDDQYHSKNLDPEKSANGDLVLLSREDLIAFAILTGSDLAGNGLPKVGCRKAIRFVRKCQLDNPMKQQTAAIDELKSWARSASVVDQLKSEKEEEAKKERQCSCCCHPGTKQSHQKEGCKLCGTEPGEPCFQVSPGGRFRKSLRNKALAMKPKFDPEWVLSAYQKPNDNQIPFVLVGKSARSLEVEQPRLRELLESSMIIRGHCLAASRDYVRQSLGSLLVRAHLFKHVKPARKENLTRLKLSNDSPVPKKIVKRLTRQGTPSLEVLWTVSATATDDEGKGIDGYEFMTVEDREVIQKCYPQLITAFENAEKEKQKQGDAEQERRRAFLESFLFRKRRINPEDECIEKSPQQAKRTRQARNRTNFFQQPSVKKFESGADGNNMIMNSPQHHPSEIIRGTVDSTGEKMIGTIITIGVTSGKSYRSVGARSRICEKSFEGGDDVRNIMKFTVDRTNVQDNDDGFDYSSIESGCCTANQDELEERIYFSQHDACTKAKTSAPTLAPAHKHFIADKFASTNESLLLVDDGVPARQATQYKIEKCADIRFQYQSMDNPARPNAINDEFADKVEKPAGLFGHEPRIRHQRTTEMIEESRGPKESNDEIPKSPSLRWDRMMPSGDAQLSTTNEDGQGRNDCNLSFHQLQGQAFQLKSLKSECPAVDGEILLTNDNFAAYCRIAGPTESFKYRIPKPFDGNNLTRSPYGKNRAENRRPPCIPGDAYSSVQDLSREAFRYDGHKSEHYTALWEDTHDSKPKYRGNHDHAEHCLSDQAIQDKEDISASRRFCIANDVQNLESKAFPDIKRETLDEFARNSQQDPWGRKESGDFKDYPERTMSENCKRFDLQCHNFKSWISATDCFDPLELPALLTEDNPVNRYQGLEYDRDAERRSTHRIICESIGYNETDSVLPHSHDIMPKVGTQWSKNFDDYHKRFNEHERHMSYAETYFPARRIEESTRSEQRLSHNLRDDFHDFLKHDEDDFQLRQRNYFLATGKYDFNFFENPIHTENRSCVSSFDDDIEVDDDKVLGSAYRDQISKVAMNIDLQPTTKDEDSCALNAFQKF